MDLQTEFAQHLLDGELHIQHCNGCNHDIMYPRHRCPFCYSSDLVWKRSAGRGTLLSFTVVRATSPTAFNADVPYGIGIVRLAEGVQLMCRLHPDTGGEFASYQCDAPVRFDNPAREELERRAVAWFRPE